MGANVVVLVGKVAGTNIQELANGESILVVGVTTEPDSLPIRCTLRLGRIAPGDERYIPKIAKDDQLVVQGWLERDRMRTNVIVRTYEVLTGGEA